jgi:hypothetical protein
MPPPATLTQSKRFHDKHLSPKERPAWQPHAWLRYHRSGSFSPVPKGDGPRAPQRNSTSLEIVATCHLGAGKQPPIPLARQKCPRPRKVAGIFIPTRRLHPRNLRRLLVLRIHHNPLVLLVIRHDVAEEDVESL